MTFTTSARRCLAFDWRLRSNDARFVHEIDALFADCAPAPRGEHGASTFDARVGPRGRVDLVHDGEAALHDAPWGLALARVAWEVNRGATEGNVDRERLLLHAAAVADAGGAVVLAGASGAGKSTLVAGLVRAGFAYLTDEVAAVRVDSGTIDPYPAPIALEPGGREALGFHVALGPTRSIACPTPEGWLVPARALGGRAAGPGSTVDLVVLPSYQASAAVGVEPLHRAATAVFLARNSFNFRSLGPTRLPTLAGVVGRAACYRLEFGDAHQAVDAVVALLREHRGVQP